METHAVEGGPQKSAYNTGTENLIAIVSLVTSVVSALAIGYIAYLQYQSTERQVKLEYARSDPHFEISTTVKQQNFSGSNQGALYLPDTLVVRIGSGEGHIDSLIVTQDVEITIFDRNHVRNTCVFRINNYYPPYGGTGEPLRAKAVVSELINSNHPVWSYGPVVVIDTEEAWVQINYHDVFGDSKTVLMTNGDQSVAGLSRRHDGIISPYVQDVDGQLTGSKVNREIVDASFVEGQLLPSGGESKLFHYAHSPESAGCIYIRSLLA